MTDKDLIRAEIERLHQESVIAAFGNDTDWLRSRRATIVDIMSFIDTLEEPVSNDLEEAAEKYADGPNCSWVGTTAL